MIDPRPKIQRIVSRYRRDKYRAAHDRCATCGLPRQGAWPGHEVSHLIRGTGRSDEPCNLLYQCWRDHRLHHGDHIRVAGVLLPVLTLGMLLMVKQAREPAQFDAVRLTVLYGKPLPALEALPRFFVLEWERSCPT